MRRHWFTISTLMGIVLIVAAGLASLRRPTEILASTWFTATLLFLGFAAISALVRRGSIRKAWIGASVAGLLYLHFAFASFVSGPPCLLTDQLICAFVETVFPNENRMAAHDSRTSSGPFPPNSYQLRARVFRNVSDTQIDLLAYTQIAHCLAIFLVSLGGAITATLRGRPTLRKRSRDKSGA